MSDLLHFSLKFLNKHSLKASSIKKEKLLDIELAIIVLLLLLLGGQRRQNYANLTIKVNLLFSHLHTELYLE